jgi:polysaccharide export outer membrane protein
VRTPGILPSCALLASFALGACALTPVSGPDSGAVRAGQHDPESVPYSFVKVTPEVTKVLIKTVPRLSGFKDRRRPGGIRFGLGDIVGVTIFEATSGGLFIPAEAGVRPGNFVTIPSQAVDVNGNISVPYAGAIRARGRTPVEVQAAIVEAIKNRAIEPQVVVTLIEQRTSLVSVLGEVGRPSRYPASAEGERILDVIARAGGPAGGGQDSWVMLDRSGRRAVAPFRALVEEPTNNVYIFPQDTVYLYREPQTFLAFGALGVQQQVAFGAWRLSLAEAVARAGGLSDNLADPASVFLYRGETRDVATQLGIDVAKFEGPIIPVVYNLNMRDPAGYFLATTFEMRNKDVIYVSNAASVEATKFMTFFRMVNGTINDPIQTAISAYTLKSLASGSGATIITTTTTAPTTPVAP